MAEPRKKKASNSGQHAHRRFGVDGFFRCRRNVSLKQIPTELLAPDRETLRFR
jgi:hypothetical protein